SSGAVRSHCRLHEDPTSAPAPCAGGPGRGILRVLRTSLTSTSALCGRPVSVRANDRQIRSLALARPPLPRSILCPGDGGPAGAGSTSPKGVLPICLSLSRVIGPSLWTTADHEVVGRSRTVSDYASLIWVSSDNLQTPSAPA